MSTQKSYYANLKTKSITHKKGDETLNAYAYLYDKNGNRTEQVETQNSTTETTSYSFDATDKLTQVAYPNQTVAYSYDKNYNRTREVTTGENPETKRFIYNSRNQLTQIINNDNSKNISYQFDGNGNQTQKSKNGVITTFVYNTQNQLVSVQEDLTTLGQFYYNYAGLRTQKTANNKTSNYSYDGDSVLTQSDTSNATTVKYDYGAEQLLSLKPQSTARQYYHNDALGSTTLLTTTTGSQQASYQYDAWGNSRGETGASDNVFGFTGHEKDGETGLYYFKARYYDPDTARFLNQDSYLGDVNTPPSLHRYLYAYGNPTVWIDPDGHESFLSDWNEASEERVENYSKQIENAESGWGAVGLGFMRGFSQLESAIATGMNAASNLGAQGFSEKARTELAATRNDLSNGFEATEKMATYAKENPAEAAKAVHQGAVNFAVDVASGDRKALGNLGGMLTPVPGTIAKSAGKGVIGATGTLVEASKHAGSWVKKTAKTAKTKVGETLRNGVLSAHLRMSAVNPNLVSKARGNGSAISVRGVPNSGGKPKAMTEGDYLRRVEMLEKNYGTPTVHSLERHGAQTSALSQYRRVKNIGYPNPSTGQRTSPTKNASKFLTHKDHYLVLKRAILEQKKNGFQKSVEVPFDRHIGVNIKNLGSHRNRGPYSAGYVDKGIVSFDEATKKFYTAHPKP